MAGQENPMETPVFGYQNSMDCFFWENLQENSIFDGKIYGFLILSGNDCYIAIENDPVEIVDFPINHGDFP